jgi:osmoprotectant transport system substrate-binding protein
MLLSHRRSTVAAAVIGLATILTTAGCGGSSSGGATTGSKITTLSQLAAYSKSHPLILAGPPECPTRPFCEPGLKQTYGMDIKSFVQTDEGGPLTIKALTSGKANVGLVFTSDPTVAASGLTVLTDDKNLQASDNIIPLVASTLSTGAAASMLNAIDAKLDQSTLVSLNKAVEIQHGTSEQVATSFLSQEGITSSACGGQTGHGNVLVGAASFAENETLADIYAAGLKQCGYSTSTKDFSSREVYYPELTKGKIQVVPEYAATLADFINDQANGANAPSVASGDINTTVAHLKAELPSGLAVLNPATATDKNAFAVKTSFADNGG